MATIKDVAKLAGVSVTTVSRCFNNRGYMSEATKNKINEACEQLNYKPNELARSLFKKKSNIVGVIVPQLDSEFFSKLVQKIENQLYEKGYKMMLCAANGDSEKEKSYFDMFRSQQVDGVIVGSYLLEDSFKYSKYDMPLVAFDRYLEGNIPCVGSDHYEMGRLATEKLIKSGCTKLAHIRGDSKVVGPPHDKTIAFEELCKKEGVEYFMVERDVKAKNSTEFPRVMKVLEEEWPGYDGIFLSDSDAASFLQYANEKGFKVPDQVQVVGYDNIPLGKFTYPQLTTVAQSFDELSESLVSVLLKVIELEGDYSKLGVIDRLDVKLIERGTTK